MVIWWPCVCEIWTAYHVTRRTWTQQSLPCRHLIPNLISRVIIVHMAEQRQVIYLHNYGITAPLYYYQLFSCFSYCGGHPDRYWSNLAVGRGGGGGGEDTSLTSCVGGINNWLFYMDVQRQRGRFTAVLWSSNKTVFVIVLVLIVVPWYRTHS